MKKYIVITTINPKSSGIACFEQMQDWHLIIVGDQKSTEIESTPNLTFLSVDQQEKLGYEIVKKCPYNHYARKNIGYLYAIQQGADIIYDTDDDNLPYNNWSIEEFHCDRCYWSTEQKFINVYQYFSDELIWPRGYPLDEISKSHQHQYEVKPIAPIKIGAWQGLADIDPDVDAIFRLIFSKEIKFKERGPIALSKGFYSPFNSQNTVWNKKAYPYLYLPATTSFRFTDILRAYIAQRLMWEQELHLGFTKATVYQQRNPHDLMRDFTDEWESYLNVKSIVKILDSINLTAEPLSNMREVYLKLISENLIAPYESSLLEAWLLDLRRLNISSF